MDNKTNIKVPNKYEERIKEIYHDDDGYWVYLNRGWRWDDCESHVIHEDTQQQILRCIRQTEPCNCNYCKGIED